MSETRIGSCASILKAFAVLAVLFAASGTARADVDSTITWVDGYPSVSPNGVITGWGTLDTNPPAQSHGLLVSIGTKKVGGAWVYNQGTLSVGADGKYYVEGASGRLFSGTYSVILAVGMFDQNGTWYYWDTSIDVVVVP